MLQENGIHLITSITEESYSWFMQDGTALHRSQESLDIIEEHFHEFNYSLVSKADVDVILSGHRILLTLIHVIFPKEIPQG